ncbi:hypothetical protein J2X69_003340 [Algoriphagus sp. 4150]|nr:hypothetical protein [Algoriphagus sp. 4150]
MSENHPQKKQSNEIPSKAEEEILDRIDPEILKGVPKNKGAEIASLIYSVQRTHSGPLPSLII